MMATHSFLNYNVSKSFNLVSKILACMRMKDLFMLVYLS